MIFSDANQNKQLKLFAGQTLVYFTVFWVFFLNMLPLMFIQFRSLYRRLNRKYKIWRHQKLLREECHFGLSRSGDRWEQSRAYTKRRLEELARQKALEEDEVPKMFDRVVTFDFEHPELCFVPVFYPMATQLPMRSSSQLDKTRQSK